MAHCSLVLWKNVACGSRVPCAREKIRCALGGHGMGTATPTAATTSSSTTTTNDGNGKDNGSVNEKGDNCSEDDYDNSRLEGKNT